MKNPNRDINEIYKLIMQSLNGDEINITNLKNNKIKFSLLIKTNASPPSPFEIILKEEKNKNDFY